MDVNRLPSPDPAAFVELHKQLGIALSAVQSLEYILCHWIVLNVELPPSRDPAEMQRLLEVQQKKMLGALFATLKKVKTNKSVDALE